MASSTQANTVVLSGFFHGDTGKATLFEIYKVGDQDLTDPRKEWFPLSQVTRMVKQPKNSQEHDTLVVNEWICRQKDLV